MEEYQKSNPEQIEAILGIMHIMEANLLNDLQKNLAGESKGKGFNGFNAKLKQVQLSITFPLDTKIRSVVTIQRAS